MPMDSITDRGMASLHSVGSIQAVPVDRRAFEFLSAADPEEYNEQEYGGKNGRGAGRRDHGQYFAKASETQELRDEQAY